MENDMNTTTEQPKQVQYAGFWWRFLAWLIDTIILSFVMWIFFLPILGIFGISLYTLKESGYDPVNSAMYLGPFIGAIISLSFISTAVKWLYFALMESSKNQGTIGKIVFKIRVTDYEGNRISFARATGRYFGKILSALIIYIGFIMAGFTDKKQALHDILANCYVVKD